MGHSEGFVDARWLAGRILAWMLQDAPAPFGEFCLLGSREQIEVVRTRTPGPVARAHIAESPRAKSPSNHEETLQSALGSSDRPPPQQQHNDLDIIFKKGILENAAVSEALRTASPGERAKFEMVHGKHILVHAWSTPRVPSTKTWRLGARKAIHDARTQNLDQHMRPQSLDDDRRPPFFYRNSALHLDRATTEEELTLQLVVVFCRWGLIELTSDDWSAFVSYLRGLHRRPEKFITAADEAVSYVLMNWVVPHRPADFRWYAKQTVWALYAKGRRPVGLGLRAGEGRATKTEVGYVSIPELAALSGTDFRRIYEAIKAKKLKAVKRGMSLWVEKGSADKFIQKALQKHRIQDLVRKLENTGKKKEGIRKQVQRLRKAGLSDAEVIERLRLELSGLQAAEANSENEEDAE